MSIKRKQSKDDEADGNSKRRKSLKNSSRTSIKNEVNQVITQKRGGSPNTEENGKTRKGHIERSGAENPSLLKKNPNQYIGLTFGKIINIALTIIAIVGAYHIYFMQRPERALEIALIHRLIREENIVESVIGELEQNEAISYMQVRVSNSGNQPISVKDFEKPLVLIFPQTVKSIESQISGRRPRDLNPEININQNTITLSPLLLNPRDEMVLFITVKHKKGALSDSPFEVTARIEGIEEIRLSNQIPVW